MLKGMLVNKQMPDFQLGSRLHSAELMFKLPKIQQTKLSNPKFVGLFLK